MERIKNNASHVLIGTLLAAAIVLAILLAIPAAPTAQAAAINATGDLTLVTCGAAGGDDLITVVDNRNGKMLTYRFDGNKLSLLSFRSLFVKP